MIKESEVANNVRAAFRLSYKPDRTVRLQAFQYRRKVLINIVDRISSIVTSRWFLNLREVYTFRSDDEDTRIYNTHSETQMSDIQFASTVIGTMGAPLNHGTWNVPEIGNGEDLGAPLLSCEPLTVGLEPVFRMAWHDHA